MRRVLKGGGGVRRVLKGGGGLTASYVGLIDAHTHKKGRNSLNDKMLGNVLVGSEGDLLHNALNHRVQPSRADVFDRRIHLCGHQR